MKPESIPESLKAIPNWVLWKYKKVKGKQTKIPINPNTLAEAKTNDSSTWTTFARALEIYQKNQKTIAGIGFVFAKGSGIIGIDLDHCIKEDSSLEPWAQEIIGKLNSYTEVTPSGKGFHILVEGQKPGTACKNGKIEMYEESRFFTVTGELWPQTSDTIENRQSEIAELYRQYFEKPEPAIQQARPAQEQTQSDLELLEIAMKNAKFSSLWSGTWQGAYKSKSEADLALCSMLAYWTNKDATRIDLLFRQSGMYAAKWDREDYRSATITKACKINIYEKKVTCKRCGTSGEWGKIGDKWKILVEGAPHICKKAASQERQQQENVPGINFPEPPAAQPQYREVKKVYTKSGNEESRFFVTDCGIFAERHSDFGVYLEKICPQAPMIKGILRDITTDKVYVVITWNTHEITVPLAAIQFTKEISQLTASGLFINSLNAKAMIEYFSTALEDVPFETHIASNNGWIKEGAAFVLGSKIISANTVEEIQFDGKAYIPSESGTREKWLELANYFKDDPGMSFRLGFSAISPALKFLSCGSSIHHYWGCSTSGKTLSSFLAISLWGKPGLLIEAWNQSQSGKETYFEEAGGLPVAMEESQKADAIAVEEAVYAFCNEKGKGRAQIRNGEVKRAKSKTWFGCMLSTGEGKITDKSKMAGVEARIIEFQRPKPELNQAKAKELAQIKNSLEMNYGLIGKEVLQFILRRGDFLKKAYSGIFDYLNSNTTGNIQSRQVSYLAAALTGVVLLRELGLPLCPDGTINEMVLSFLREEPPKSTAQKAYDFITDFVLVNKGKFETIQYPQGNILPATDNKETWGKIDEKEDGGFVEFIPSILKAILFENGFEESVLYLLREDGKLNHDAGKLTKAARIRGKLCKVVSIAL